MVDVSLILNVHDEARFVVRTLRSLEEASRYARRQGIDVELVLVMDRPDPVTERLLGRQDYAGFGEVRAVKVDKGPLGPSRNDGGRSARGRYICLCDADDLVSFNSLSEAYAVAQRSPRRSVVVPHYLVGFGQDHFVNRYFGTDVTNVLDFVGTHPISRRYSRCASSSRRCLSRTFRSRRASPTRTGSNRQPRPAVRQLGHRRRAVALPEAGGAGQCADAQGAARGRDLGRADRRRR